jgi:SAM-dependent methyltransferase
MLSHDTSLTDAFPFLNKPVDTFTNEERLFHEQIEWLQKLPNDYGSILDVGCGFGYQCKFFEIMGHTVTGCDSYDRFLYNDTIEFIKCTVEELPLNKKYDAIFTSHVLEHNINLRFFFNHIKALLNDGGWLFIAVPCSEVTENGHWLEGWSIPQVGMMLASLGFDCRDSFFGKWGYSTVGFGKKTNRKENDFLIDECLPFLPQKFAELRQAVGQGCILYRNVSYVDNESIVRTTQSWGMIDPVSQNHQPSGHSHTAKLWRMLRFWS